MAESKIPIYAYVDETGNTGHNLFDKTQPDFFTGALITRGDFDASHGMRTREIARHLGHESLHGKELGFWRIEDVSKDLYQIFQSSRAHFFVSRVEKRYLLATKVFDVLFDSGENAAVAWHHYNLRLQRLMLTFKLASVMQENSARLLWNCILEPNEKRAYAGLPVACKAILGDVESLKDPRAKEVLQAGLIWARDHPESIQIYVERKQSRQGHFPNLVAFTNLLKGLDNLSSLWRRPVHKITHDEQSEFSKTLTAYHTMFSNASEETFRWAGEEHKFQLVPSSQLIISKDSLSPGVQIADVVLWLYHQFRKGKELPSGCLMLVMYVLEHGWETDFSFDGISRQIEPTIKEVFEAPFPPEKAREAMELLRRMEEHRQLSIQRYNEDGLPPFMRASRADAP
ncbi:DUF3800 domain-containing protein [Salinarimonas sp. NSM]|uniref:DUF3800 domain-containing protein n=1 Tax=Salinarimonas sp. NSM TaxID=3458003 RepID=UPI0040367001